MIAYPYFEMYHATKWAIEGWTESMAFELEPFGIQIKTIQPGPTKTDFGGRSLVNASHPAYDANFNKFSDAFLSKDILDNLPPVESVSEVIYEAATDGKKQLRYLAGKIALNNYAKRVELGAEGFHWDMQQLFFKK